MSWIFIYQWLRSLPKTSFALMSFCNYYYIKKKTNPNMFLFVFNNIKLYYACPEQMWNQYIMLWSSYIPQLSLLLKSVSTFKIFFSHIHQINVLLSWIYLWSLQQVFCPLSGHFDVTIKLKDKLNLQKHKYVVGSSDFHYAARQENFTKKCPMPVVDFNPFVLLHDDLKVLVF